MSVFPCLRTGVLNQQRGSERPELLPAIGACCLAAQLFFTPGIGLANDNCHESSGVFTCEGDQSAGVQNGHNNLNTNADDVIVENLNQDIGPNLNSSRTAGLMFTYDSGDDLTTLTLKYLESTHKIFVNSSAQSGILFAGPVKNGDDGKHHDTSSGGNGDAGKPGRSLDLTLNSGATILGGSDAITTGINVNNPGGDGGEGGGSDCCSGGHGGDGGQGGNVSIVGGGSVTMQGPESPAVSITSSGGLGGKGHDSSVEHGGNGEVGGAAGLVQLDSAGSWTLSTSGVGDEDAIGVAVRNFGADGGDGGKGETHGGDGGGGGSGHAIKVNKRDSGGWTITTVGDLAAGMSLSALGGGGGHGGHGDDDHGGKGGQGGQGGAVEFGQGSYDISTSGKQSSGLFVYSKAGSGGNGGSTEFSDSPGDGGSGGGGGALTVADDWQVETGGTQSHGLALYSLGAAGGQGGSGDFTSGGAGGSTGASGAINVNISGAIATSGGGALGLVAQSVAGHAGSGGESDGIVSFAGNGGSAGAGGTVTLTSSAAVTTRGDQSTAITAQSIGGGGGSGGNGFSEYYSAGGSGGLGGAGGAVTVTNRGNLQARGNDAHGIFAQSIGGAGGSGGNAGGIVSLGGGGKSGANGGTVSVTNSAVIATGVTSGSAPAGPDPVCGTGCSLGILAQSIGGGGGHGGTAVGAFSVGGAGGKGGNGAKVTVSTSGDVSTTQIHSSAIHAQSIGGGGGNGGGGGALDAVLSVAVGGSGGDGGNGGQAVVKPTDGSAIATVGDDSHGVHAQSVGGSGGNAGFAVSAAAGVDVPALDIAVGASGGGGGVGGAVTIDTVNSSYAGSALNTVTTAGERANGLFAQSVGGGGGNGGLTVAFASSNTVNASVAVGGSGGSGGSGGAVTLSSDARSSTSGDNSNPLIAQSIGGGGGNGGTTVSGTLNLGDGGVSVGIGGGGGVGGGAATVDVTLSGNGSARASGDQSIGIVAQSIGGGGGNGGTTIVGTVSSGNSTTFGVALGSAAGSGGSAAAVSVVTEAGTSVATSGNGGIGVQAQSVGGGGGNGGITLNANIAASSDATQSDVTLGSDGGSGGDGNTVTVNNAATISTGDSGQFGYTQAHGLVSQSIGGGGGKGAVTGFLQLSADAESGSHLLDITLSGSGNGGKGGTATIANSGAVSTVNRNSHALFAQSVGGGGGDADAAMWSLIDYAANDPTPSFSTDYVGGGSLGAGNTGGSVAVSNTALLSTAGPWSHGIFAHSVGGGGGSSAPLGNPFAPCASCNSLAVAWNATIALGGQTGSGGDGGDITVTNSNGISTSGPGSDAIFAQSIGAGGGSGGAASALSQGGQFIGATEFTALDIALGAAGTGSSPVSGNGGTIVVEHSAGAIVTSGIGSTGIYAQSVGAGGGRGGIGAIGGGGKVDVGGNGDAAGDGGDVTISVTGGSIKTGTGTAAAGIVSAAYGIFAQSVGGGGGHAGNVLFGSTDNFASAIGLTSSKGNDSSGSGGDVSVTLATGLTTSGDSSVGILAQSVGGGGGIQGETGKNQSGAKAGSNGGSGKAGSVAVTVSGSVTTSGTNAHGIWAQTAGGSDNSTSSDTLVSVNLNGSGSVLAEGTGTIGIYAQSTGDGRGKVEVNLNSADNFVVGETAIYIKDAPTSSISNSGGISAQDPNNGVAVQAENTTLTITNTSTGGIDGKVCKGSSCGSGTSPGSSLGHVTLNNRPGGRVTSTRLEVDAFNNSGTLDIGGVGNTTQIIITGNYSSSASSTLVVELDPSRSDAGAIDSLLIGGVADLSGSIDLRLKDVGLQTGPRSWALVTALGGITPGSDQRLLLPGSTAVMTLELEQHLQQLLLNYEVDFANERVEAAANDDQAAIAEHLQRVFLAGGDELQALLEALATINDPAAYADSLDGFKPELYADNQLTALFAGQRFGDQLMSCSQHDGEHRFIAQGQCVWASLSAQRLKQVSSDEDFGFDEDSQQLAAGVQFDLGKQWFLGGGLGYEDSDLNLKQGRGDSKGARYHGGLSVKRQFGASMLAASFSGGVGRFDVRRNVGSGQSVDGNQDLSFVSGQLRATHAFEFGTEGDGWAIKPRLDLGIDHVRSGSVSEHGGGSLSLEVEDSSDTWYSIQPAVDVQGEWSTAAGTLLRPAVTVGLTHFLNDRAPSSTAVFSGSPAGIAGFENSSDLDRTYLDLAAGLEVISNKGWSISLAAAARLSGDIRSYGGSLRLAVPF